MKILFFLALFFFSVVKGSAIAITCPDGQTLFSDKSEALLWQKWELERNTLQGIIQNNHYADFYGIAEDVMDFGSEGYYLKFGQKAATYFQKEFVPYLIQKHEYAFAHVVDAIGQELIVGAYFDIEQVLHKVTSALCSGHPKSFLKKSKIQDFLERAHIRDHKRAYLDGGFATLTLAQRVAFLKTPPFLFLIELMRKYPVETSEAFSIALDGLFKASLKELFF